MTDNLLCSLPVLRRASDVRWLEQLGRCPAVPCWRATSNIQRPPCIACLHRARPPPSSVGCARTSEAICTSKFFINLSTKVIWVVSNAPSSQSRLNAQPVNQISPHRWLVGQFCIGLRVAHHAPLRLHVPRYHPREQRYPSLLNNDFAENARIGPVLLETLPTYVLYQEIIPIDTPSRLLFYRLCWV